MAANGGIRKRGWRLKAAPAAAVAGRRWAAAREAQPKVRAPSAGRREPAQRARVRTPSVRKPSKAVGPQGPLPAGAAPLAALVRPRLEAAPRSPPAWAETNTRRFDRYANGPGFALAPRRRAPGVRVRAAGC